MSGSFEGWDAFIAAHLSEPVNRDDHTDGEVLFTGGSPEEVIVQLTRTSITVWEYAVRRRGELVVLKPRLVGVVRWARLGERATMKAVQALMDGAREARLARFRVCRLCAERRPPEWMHDVDICRSCASQPSDSVH